MKGSLLSTRPTLGGTLLGFIGGLVAVALFVLLGLDDNPTMVSTLIVMVGAGALASLPLVVMPLDWPDRVRPRQRVSAPVELPAAPVQLRLVPAMPERKPFDWAVDGL